MHGRGGPGKLVVVVAITLIGNVLGDIVVHLGLLGDLRDLPVAVAVSNEQFFADRNVAKRAQDESDLNADPHLFVLAIDKLWQYAVIHQRTEADTESGLRARKEKRQLGADVWCEKK